VPGLEVIMRKGAVNLFCFFFIGPWLSLCGSEGSAAGGGVTSGGEKASGWIFFMMRRLMHA